MEAIAINTDKIISDKAGICSTLTLTDLLLPKLRKIIKCLRTCASSLHLFAAVSDGYLITLLQLLFPLSALLCYTIQILCYAGRHPQADAGPSGMPRGCGMVWKSMPKDCGMVW